jgi:VanZ family protein
MIRKNIISILIAFLIMYLSLASQDTFDKFPVFPIPFFDKIVHFGMYFVLMSAIIFEHRKTLKNNKYLFLTALIPLFYGILMEVLQATLTVNRSGSIYDAIFNFMGILFSALLWLWIKPRLKESVR